MFFDSVHYFINNCIFDENRLFRRCFAIFRFELETIGDRPERLTFFFNFIILTQCKIG
jgi:hypothetical protein